MIYKRSLRLSGMAEELRANLLSNLGREIIPHQTKSSTLVAILFIPNTLISNDPTIHLRPNDINVWGPRLFFPDE